MAAGPPGLPADEELGRSPALIVQANGATAALNMFYPYPKQKSAPLPVQARPTADVVPAEPALAVGKPEADAPFPAATHVAAE